MQTTQKALITDVIVYTRTLTLISIRSQKSIYFKLKMVSIAKQIVIEKSAVITFDNEVDEMAFRRYLKNNWENLTLGLKNSTILFLAGVHGEDSGKLGPNEDIQTLKNQVRIILNS